MIPNLDVRISFAAMQIGVPTWLVLSHYLGVPNSIQVTKYIILHSPFLSHFFLNYWQVLASLHSI